MNHFLNQETIDFMVKTIKLGTLLNKWEIDALKKDCNLKDFSTTQKHQLHDIMQLFLEIEILDIKNISITGASELKDKHQERIEKIFKSAESVNHLENKVFNNENVGMKNKNSKYMDLENKELYKKIEELLKVSEFSEKTNKMLSAILPFFGNDYEKLIRIKNSLEESKERIAKANEKIAKYDKILDFLNQLENVSIISDESKRKHIEAQLKELGVDTKELKSLGKFLDSCSTFNFKEKNKKNYFH